MSSKVKKTALKDMVASFNAAIFSYDEVSQFNCNHLFSQLPVELKSNEVEFTQKVCLLHHSFSLSLSLSLFLSLSLTSYTLLFFFRFFFLLVVISFLHFCNWKCK